MSTDDASDDASDSSRAGFVEILLDGAGIEKADGHLSPLRNQEFRDGGAMDLDWLSALERRLVGDWRRHMVEHAFGEQLLLDLSLGGRTRSLLHWGDSRVEQFAQFPLLVGSQRHCFLQDVL